jgi:mannonate dehydratase
VSTPAFGYQESHTYNDATHEVFPGTPVVRDRWAAGVRRPDGSLAPP